ncbi:alkaline phosphatase family protein [Paractinoplanes globisporus]|uniref:Alkaline phosphatase family protein n=1 Tax=Paractinoplanes globisporus TaxID=113565 RepID=A0ABW6WRW4_9ACTN|nr:alkaline phosphatase family protein [Actinoplanes globisporus]
MAGRERIEHIVVLMMENRSFDHLIGFLDHDSPDYPRLDRIDVSCPEDPKRPGSPRVRPTPTASPVLGTDPDHSHQAVMDQIAGDPPMSGFIASYLHKIKHGTSRPMSWWQRALNAVLGFLKTAWSRLTRRRGPIPAQARDIMRCFPPAEIPVLGFLAKQYAVLTGWHASVPGETWPNRQYAHAATSHGTANIKVDFYTDTTVFERLSEAGRTWSIYVDGVAQVWAYPKLWMNGTDHFHDMDRLLDDIRRGTLPDYAFIEPNHGFGPGEGNSQHPGNNLVSGDSFTAGEALMARVYNALVASPELFASTLLLITYDEHGGFFDHVAPQTVTPPDKHQDHGFDFSLSGVRVPAVAVSPLIPAGTVKGIFYEHASIPAMVLHQFAPGTPSLTERDAHSADPLDELRLLPAPRTDIRPVPEPARRPAVAPPARVHLMNDFQGSLVDLAGGVHNALEERRTLTAARTDEPPQFRHKTSTKTAAETGVLIPGSEASEVVDEVVSAFVD